MDQSHQSMDSTNTLQDTHKSKCKHRITTPTRQKPNIGYVVIPYTQSIAESFKNISAKYGIQTYFKGNMTIKQALMKPKDQDPKDKKSWVIHSYKCGDICLWWGVHRGNIKDSGWKIQEAPQTTLSHQCTHPINWTYINNQQLEHHWEGGPGPGQDHKRSHLYKEKQSTFKQEL